MSYTHFLDLHELDASIIKNLLADAALLKQQQKEGQGKKWLEDKQLAMIFEKSSTRTRVSFEVGIKQLGGHAVILDASSSQLGRGETIADTAKVLSRYVDIIMIRCFSHDSLLELAKHADVPVINGLTDFSHPCQIMADLLAVIEHKGKIEGLKVAWVGDSNNVLNSWIHAAGLFKFDIHVASPRDYQPSPAIMGYVKKSHASVKVTESAEEAVEGADVVITDTWVSMGDEDKENRLKTFAPYQVDLGLMSKADDKAIFLHCLPAHRGEEVTDEVIDGKHSVVWDEAENRLHVQKAIMAWCLGVAIS